MNAATAVPVYGRGTRGPPVRLAVSDRDVIDQWSLWRICDALERRAPEQQPSTGGALPARVALLDGLAA